MSYWKGSVFIGHDKTYLESLYPKTHLWQGSDLNLMGLLAWRNLQLVGLSCCGIDNVAVFFQQANKHMYLVPFVDLVPGSGERLKKENINMYRSFKSWWEETGRRPMPEPAMVYKGSGRYEWEVMKVSMKPSRMPEGWLEFIEAAIALRLEEVGFAQACLRTALQRNPALQTVAKEWLPEIARGLAVPAIPSPAAADDSQQYIVCYNPHVGLGNVAVVMVSAHWLAKLTGRTLIMHWNVNLATSQAFKLRESPQVKLMAQYAESKEVVFPGSVKHIYFFHMMNSEKLGDTLELLGCQDLTTSLSSHKFVTVSSNLYFAAVLRENPTVPPGTVPPFNEMLNQLVAPSDAAAQRALGLLRESGWGKADWWGKGTPVVAIHVRAREEGEDNDDWPTASSPNRDLLDKLRDCLEIAVKRDLRASSFDIFVASTTEAARSAVVAKMTGMPGLRNIITLKDLDRNRKEASGAVDAMAESLLISRADLFMRLVVGTTGFSTFAYLSNALRVQNEWVSGMPWLKREGSMPNYVVTEDCGKDRCFSASSEVRMANVAWHGKQFTQRSCGDPVAKFQRKNGQDRGGCGGMRAVVSASAPLGDEL